MSLIVQAVLASFPFAWGVGVLIARILAGPEFGVLPALLIPPALIGALAFSLLPMATPLVRRNFMLGGAVASWIGMALFV